MSTHKLLGRVILHGVIEAKTGLHIGGSPGALAIGNVDLPVIRDAGTNQPYIPGSSLKGKMRSLSEKLTGAPQNKGIGKDVKIHVAETAEQYGKYWVNPVFGVPGEVKFPVTAPNRLIVRDVPMTAASALEWRDKKTDQPFTEVKWEVAIDRVTSAATPRQIERVPAGAKFGPMELVLSLYLKEDVQFVANLLTALQLVEDDYLGGQGSRGSGKVVFQGLSVTCRHGEGYQSATDGRFTGVATLADLLAQQADLLKWVSATLAV